MSSFAIKSSSYEALFDKCIDPYVVLQLTGRTSVDNNNNDRSRINRENIESSYRRLSVLHHPYRCLHRYQLDNNSNDNNNNNEIGYEDDVRLHQIFLENNTRFVLIAASYEVLMKEETKTRFDTLSYDMKMKAIRFHQQ